MKTSKKNNMAPVKMYKEPAPAQFNSGLREASASGKLDNNPKFKAAVDGAAKFYSGSGSKKGAAKMMQKSFMPQPTGPMKNYDKDMAEERIQIKDDKQKIYQDDKEKRKSEGY